MRKRAESIVILTGAGISKESGIDTFRDAGGVWTKVNVEDVATPEGFQRNPELVQSFYNERRAQLVTDGVEPNAAHHALVELEQRWRAPVLVITQNIDDLHDRAGQQKLIHMHGELLKIRCERCGVIHVWKEAVETTTTCPACGRTSCLRPHVVWFGEMPLEMDRIFDALTTCSIFVSIGTSGEVAPAASFVQMARIEAGAHTVELNLEPSRGSSFFDECRYGPASEIVPSFVEELLARP
ncbi:MAG: Sir2 family NAD+-dependent deacetylase [Myxococcota bacterium]